MINWNNIWNCHSQNHILSSTTNQSWTFVAMENKTHNDQRQ